jgi:hypothetical protein
MQRNPGGRIAVPAPHRPSGAFDSLETPRSELERSSIHGMECGGLRTGVATMNSSAQDLRQFAATWHVSYFESYLGAGMVVTYGESY